MMKNRIHLNKKYQVILGVFFSLLYIILLILNFNMILVTILYVWLIILLYCLTNPSSHAVLLAFITAFFTFLLGRQFLVEFFGYSADPIFDIYIDNHANILMLISLLSLFSGYLFFYKINTVNRRKNIEKFKYDYIKLVRKISLHMFYLLYVFLIILTLSTVMFVMKYGYLSYYIEYSLRIPYIFKKLADMAPISFFVFLSTFPSKREIKTPLVLYVLYVFLTLGTGKRYPFVANILMILVYMLIRNGRDKEIWITKKTIFSLLALCPLLLIMMNYVNYSRFGISSTHNSFLQEILNFFYKTGSSVNVIKYEELIGDNLNPDKLYSMGSTISFLTENIISRIFGVVSYSGNNVLHATLGNSFDHAISYAAWGNYYLAGNGMGSSYIAELYHDFSYCGLIIGNFIYSFCINRFFNLRSKNLYMNSIYLISLYTFLMSPRGSFDGFFSSLLDMTTWGTILIIYIVSQMYYKKRKDRV